MSIEVQAVSKYYGAQKALDSVSFSVQKGEIVGFLGPNGAGKSTLMKILTTYLNADEGSAAINGHDVVGQAKAVQRVVGYLPEHNPLYWTCMFVNIWRLMPTSIAFRKRESRK